MITKEQFVECIKRTESIAKHLETLLGQHPDFKRARWDTNADYFVSWDDKLCLMFYCEWYDDTTYVRVLIKDQMFFNEKLGSEEIAELVYEELRTHETAITLDKLRSERIRKELNEEKYKEQREKFEKEEYKRLKKKFEGDKNECGN